MSKTEARLKALEAEKVKATIQKIENAFNARTHEEQLAMVAFTWPRILSEDVTPEQAVHGGQVLREIILECTPWEVDGFFEGEYEAVIRNGVAYKRRTAW